MRSWKLLALIIAEALLPEQPCHGTDLDFWVRMNEERAIKAAPDDETRNLGIQRRLKSGVK